MLETSNFKYRILVIGRKDESAKILKNIFDEEGFESAFETSVEKGFKKVLKQHYDLIISEIHLGQDQMSGLDLLQKIRENNTTVPFVVISDISSVESSVKAINYGVSGFLVKPLNQTETAETVRRAIRYHKGSFLKNELDSYRMENAFSAVIASKEQSILKLLDTVDNLVELVYPKDYGNFSDLKMAIYEGLSNAVEHGNKNQPDKNIFFKLELKMDKIKVHIKDEGEGYKPTEIMNQQNGMQGINRGLNLIHHLVDEVSFNIKGNEINLLRIMD